METRILVIEDNPSSLELMGYLLESFRLHPDPHQRRRGGP